MSTTSKKPKALLVKNLTKLVSKHATRAQPAEKTSGTSRQTHKGNPELDAVPDQHNVLSDITVTAEDKFKEKVYVIFCINFNLKTKSKLTALKLT